MARPKPTLESTSRKLSGYKFDTTGYILLHSTVHREFTTGKLTDRKISETGPKTGKYVWTGVQT